MHTHAASQYAAIDLERQGGSSFSGAIKFILLLTSSAPTDDTGHPSKCSKKVSN